MANQMFELNGKVAIVTGGNGGIGLGIAKGLARGGADIVVAARNQEKTENAIRQIVGIGAHALGIVTDVTDDASVVEMVNRTLEEFGRIDILVNNSGVVIRKSPEEHSIEDWMSVMDVNLNGTFRCSKQVYPHMVKIGGGKIINNGSMFSIFGSDWVSAYSASKGGVVQLTKSLAVAWAKDNIQVNVILPGWIHTELTSDIRTQFPERYSFIKSRIPKGRWGEPDDVAGAAVFLASSSSDYVTGVSVPVDGGYIAF